MATSDLNLRGIRSVEQLLTRTPQGAELIELLRSMGFWMGGTNPLCAELQRKFPVNVSRLTSDQLGDEAAYWQSELTRVTMICGVLDAQRLGLSARVARARSAAAARVLRAVEPDGRPPTAAQLEVAVAEDPHVQDCEDQLLLVNQVLTALKTVRDGYDGYCRGLSREVTRVGDVMRYHT